MWDDLARLIWFCAIISPLFVFIVVFKYSKEKLGFKLILSVVLSMISMLILHILAAVAMSIGWSNDIF